jgi:hypothetical protein
VYSESENISLGNGIGLGLPGAIVASAAIVMFIRRTASAARVARVARVAPASGHSADSINLNDFF